MSKIFLLFQSISIILHMTDKLASNLLYELGQVAKLQGLNFLDHKMRPWVISNFL